MDGWCNGEGGQGADESIPGHQAAATFPHPSLDCWWIVFRWRWPGSSTGMGETYGGGAQLRLRWKTARTDLWNFHRTTICSPAPEVGIGSSSHGGADKEPADSSVWLCRRTCSDAGGIGGGQSHPRRSCSSASRGLCARRNAGTSSRPEEIASWRGPVAWWAAPLQSLRHWFKEWTKICRAGFERKMMYPLQEREVFRDHRGRPVFNGAMAVPKIKKIDGKEVRLQRFISNLVPTNTYQKHLPGDDIHFPYLGQMAVLSLNDDEELLIESEDLTSCYNLFTFPREWAPFMAFGKAVDSSVFDLPPGEPMYPAMVVIPMGWLSAVALTQCIVRHLVFDLSGVAPESEVRKTADFPETRDISVIYVDSFDELRRIDKGCRTCQNLTRRSKRPVSDWVCPWLRASVWWLPPKGPYKVARLMALRATSN